MTDPVDQLLLERRSRGGSGLAAGLLAALLLHGAVLATALLAPAPGREQPLEYVAVQVVPLQALGSRQPAPQQRPEPPAAREEPAPPAPEPEPRPEPRSSPSPAAPAAEPSPAAPAPGPAAPREPGGGEGSERTGSQLGSERGYAAFGATRLEGIDPDFTYDYYLDQMLALIHGEWVRPPTEGEVRAVVRFTVHRDGEIADISIEESSGFNAFDLAALRAVTRAGPLPPLPASYRRDELRVTLIVR